MDEIEKKLVAELESKQNTLLASNQRQLVESAEESKKADESGEDTEVQKSSFMEKLEDKKKELVSFIFNLYFLFFSLIIMGACCCF